MSHLHVEIIREEAIQTSQIEGEFLDRESVQSSLRRHFGLQTESTNKLLKEKGISDLLIDVYEDYDEPLSHDLFQRWHGKLFSGQRTDAGQYRSGKEAMQVISGAIHAPTVHFEAPPSGQIDEELAALISLSTAIERKKKNYYDAFSRVQSGEDNEISSWLEYFSALVIDAQNLSLLTIDFVIKKGRLLTKYRDHLNERQSKVVMRVLQEGVHGFRGGLSAGNYMSFTRAPSTTATRDLNDLVKKEVFTKKGERKHTRYFINFPE